MSSKKAREHDKLEAKRSTVFSVLAKATHEDEADLAGHPAPACPESVLLAVY